MRALMVYRRMLWLWVQAHGCLCERELHIYLANCSSGSVHTTSHQYDNNWIHIFTSTLSLWSLIVGVFIYASRCLRCGTKTTHSACLYLFQSAMFSSAVCESLRCCCCCCCRHHHSLTRSSTFYPEFALSLSSSFSFYFSSRSGKWICFTVFFQVAAGLHTPHVAHTATRWKKHTAPFPECAVTEEISLFDFVLRFFSSSHFLAVVCYLFAGFAVGNDSPHIGIFFRSLRFDFCWQSFVSLWRTN